MCVFRMKHGWKGESNKSFEDSLASFARHLHKMLLKGPPVQQTSSPEKSTMAQRQLVTAKKPDIAKKPICFQKTSEYDSTNISNDVPPPLPPRKSALDEPPLADDGYEQVTPDIAVKVESISEDYSKLGGIYDFCKLVKSFEVVGFPKQYEYNKRDFAAILAYQTKVKLKDLTIVEEERKIYVSLAEPAGKFNYIVRHIRVGF